MFKYCLIFLSVFSCFPGNAVYSQEALPNFIGYYENMPIFLTNPYSRDRSLNLAEERLANLIYDGLLVRNIKQDVTSGIPEIQDILKPNMVERFQSVLLDERWTYYFMLRKDLVWSDGQPVLLDDIEAFYGFLKEYVRRIKLPGYESFIRPGRLPNYLFHTLLTREQRERSFGIQFARKQAVFTSLFTMPIIRRDAFTGNFAEKPIGTGRYTVQRFQQQGSVTFIILQKNYAHPLFKSSNNNINRITIQAFSKMPDPQTVANHFQDKKQCNLIFHPNSTFRALIGGMMSQGEDYKLYSFDTNNHHALIFNNTKEYLSGDNGKTIRRALNTLCGRDLLKDKNLEHKEVPWGTNLTPSMVNTIFQGRWNDKLAIDELYKAGYTPSEFNGVMQLKRSGRQMALKIYVIAEEEDILNKITGYITIPFKKIGIDIKIEKITIKDMLERIKQSAGKNILSDRDWDLCYWSFSTVGLSKMEEIDSQNYGLYRSSSEMEEELKNLRNKPGMGGYIDAVTKILQYCQEDPPFVEMFKIKSELFGDKSLIIPDELRSGRVNLFNTIHEWYYE